ncbi:PCP reductase family protein [Aestuariirhabdus litorea]|nr:PCP reductase family protein [Aestuariirhabdus litorea]
MEITWTGDARARLDRIPEGPMRAMVHRVIETLAGEARLSVVTLEYVEQVLAIFQQGASVVEERLPWDDSAREGIARAPQMIRGMLVREIEQLARERGQERVDETVVKQAKARWQQGDAFHLDPADPRSNSQC